MSPVFSKQANSVLTKHKLKETTKKGRKGQVGLHLMYMLRGMSQEKGSLGWSSALGNL